MNLKRHTSGSTPEQLRQAQVLTHVRTDDRPDLHEELAVWLQWAEVYFEAEPVELKVTELLPGDKVHVDGYLLTVASVAPSYFGEYKVEERYPDLRLGTRTRLTLVRPTADG